MADHVLAALRFFMLGHRAEERLHFIEELGQERAPRESAISKCCRSQRP